MQYAYNGRGEQVRRYLGSTNTYTVYDEAGHWLGDYDDTGAPVQQALWMDDLPVGLLANGHQLHYVQPDHLGSPRVVIEAARNVPVWTWDLKGEAFGSTAPQQDPDGEGIPFVLDMRFPGQRYDAASALNQNYFRDYDASTGRYAQSDPIGQNGGLNTYLYVNGNPISHVDSLGLGDCFYSIEDRRLVCYPSLPETASVNIRVSSGNNGAGMQCKDNPACTNVRSRGPIPTGEWIWTDGWTSKPNGRVLVPMPGTEVNGRDLFRSHSCVNPFGPSLGPRFCSEGCVTGTSEDIQDLNNFIDAEPGSTLRVMDTFFPKMPPRFW